jgi:hypothetical protein
MNKILILSFFSLLTLIGFSQKLIIEDNIKLAPGIYLTFNEFKFNNPAIPLESIVESHDYKRHIFDSKSEFKYYTISITSEIAKRIGYVYGFCDGKDVYYNDTYENIGPDLKFIKLDYIGRYSYFQKLKPVLTGNSVKYIITHNVIDINDGSTVYLDNSDIKNIIKDDPEITKDYKTKNYKSIGELIITYSENNKHSFIINSDFSNVYKEHVLMLEVYKNLNHLNYKDTTELYENYIYRILDYEKFEDFVKIKKVESFYSNGKKKYCGLKAKHLIGSDGVDFYKIGTWVYFDINGNLEKTIQYNLWGREKNLNIKVRFN